MLEKITKRVIGGIVAAVMAISNVSPIVPIYADEDMRATVCEETTGEFDLEHKSIELYPDEQNEEKTVMLEGLMPEGAEAQAVDVSDEHEGIAAYEITITAGESEYQPGEENPILVEISDPVIHDSDCLQLWHIRDDGEREQICDFSVEEGKISFYATGFSVYQIVEDANLVPVSSNGRGWRKITDVADLANYGEGSSGLYISSTNGFYFTNETYKPKSNEPRTGIKKTFNSNHKGTTTDEAIGLGAVPYYFQKVEGTNNQFYVYCRKAGNTLYVANNNNNYLLLVDENNKTSFTVTNNGNNFSFQSTGYDYYWNMQGNDNGNGFCSYSSATDLNLWYYVPLAPDPYELNGKTYGLMHYVSGATGHALMASDNNAMELLAYVIRQNEAGNPETVYVAEDADISEWKFENVVEDRYYIYADFGDNRKYLKIPSEGDYPSFVTVSTGDPIPDGLEIQVVPNSKGKIKLVANGKSIKLNTVSDGAGNERAVFQSVDASQGEYINLVDLTELPEHNKVVTYKAREVSVSDVKDGEELIIYTRVWNDTAKRYDFYALADDGTLVPCYERGDSIMWLSGKRNTLIWNFTEYHYDYTNTPNYYYELYNPYSQKYVAPIRPNASLLEGQVLGDEKIGINLPGRKKGDFYTDILAWDDVSYSYSGLGITADGKQTEPTTRHLASTFYFARLVDMKNDLTEVATVNNNDYGITMKMVNFDELSKEQALAYVNASAAENGLSSTTIGNYGTSVRSRFTWEYLGGISNGGKDSVPRQGLLSTNLVNGYPLSNIETYHNVQASGIPNQNYNQSIAPAFADATTVNHLFIQSILDQSGYFEYDSCQNYATLKQGDTTGTDFYVSKEIGTHDATKKSSLQHGQFFPYDDIDMDTYATVNNENLYTATLDSLDDNDPRKFEKLHLIESPDYYFGMELEASFTQTPDGKDNWGHDIIFEFTGDDDFWFYVNNELVIDLGGTHSALAGSVNFATGDVVVNGVKTNLRDVFINNFRTRYQGVLDSEAYVTDLNAFLDQHFDWDPNKNEYEKVFKDYTKHTMRIFYMERGASASNLHMRFNLSYVKPGDVVLTKEISGTDDLDFEMVEYPFQIYYRFNENGEEHILGDETDDTQDAAVFITYENSTKTVERLQTYKPPGSMSAAPYKSVFFVNPQNKAVVHFPTNTYQYKIVECGMDKDIYDQATINGVVLDATNVGGSNANQPSVRQNGDRYDYDSGWMTVQTQGFATYNNRVDPSGLRRLRFTKELYDNDYTYAANLSSDYKNKHKMTAEQDPTTFTFRLYLSNGVSDELPLAYMVNYRVLDPENYYCTWNSLEQKFDRYVYNGNYIKLDELDTLLESFSSKEEKDAFLRKMTFECSMNGSISKIPAWYTVEVPNLPVGLTFMVEERDTTTERPLGYERVIYEREAGTYNLLESGVENKGRIEKDKSPMLRVINQRGYELQAVKEWSDKDFVAGHDNIFMALYVKNESGGYDLASGYITSPVRRLTSPNTEIRFFMNRLGDKSLNDFAIFEVLLTNDNYTVDEKGFVTLGSGTEVEPIENGGMKLIIPSADRIIEANSTFAVFQNVEFLDTDNASDWSVQKQFDTQSNLYGDRLIKAGNVPNYLLGAEYLRTADDSKSCTGNLCTFTAGSDADIYVAWDDRSGPKPSWLNGWVTLTDTFTTATTPPVTMTLFKKTVSQGDTVTLGSNLGDSTPTVSYHSYVVLAVPKYSEGRIINPKNNWNANWTIQKAFDSSSFPYNDRNVRVDDDDFPEKYTGAEYLRTTASAGSSELQVKTNSVVYVALDSEVTSLPDWLSGWKITNDTIKTSNGRTMVLYSKDSSENDIISLGGNSVTGDKNPYFVLALPKYTYETEYNIGSQTNAMTVLKGTANADDITGLYSKDADNQYHLAAASERPVRKLQSDEIKYYLQSDDTAIDQYKIYKLDLSGYKFTVDQNGTVTVNEDDINIGEVQETTYSSPDINGKAKITATYNWASSEENGVFVALYHNTNGTWNRYTETEIKRLISPVSKVSYTVNLPTDLPEGTTAEQYLQNFKVFAVTIAGNGYLIDKDGYMTQISSSGSAEETFSESQVQMIEQITATPVTFTTREDTISNTRQGGVEIDLYRMGTRDVPSNHIGGNPGIALQGGVFELYHGDELIGTYVSNERGRITVMYNYVQDDYYTLIQTTAPKSYIGLQEPVVFKVRESPNKEVNVYRITDSESPAYETVNDAWRNYHFPMSEGDKLVAYIDVYNKPFILQAIKVDSKEVDGEGNPKPIQGVTFALYHGVKGIDGWTPGSIVKPVETYGNLMTDENGHIANISQALEEGVYFLKEVSAKSGYKLLDRYIRINVTENDVDIGNGQDDPTAHVVVEGSVTTVTLNSGIKLIKTDDDNSRTCKIIIPNEKAQSDYYFDIEKIIFVDKNIHDSDKKQKFVFRVDRFDENETAFTDPNIRGTFYVTLNCNKEMVYTADDNITLDGANYNYSFFHEDDTVSLTNSKFRTADSYVEKQYTAEGKADNYDYPAAIWNGRKTVRVMKEGIYRISEVDKWSSTDYDLWYGSNRYKGYGDGTHEETVITNGFRDSTTTGSMALPAADKSCVYINVKNVRAGEFDTASKTLDSKIVWRPTASFTNSETEYAYLSSQAYADNTISR
ncbi:SpaA isopeptide-forming pilin-related protein [Ruminococcus flavefaciens]|uniref:SpaA isopeptide-forming pilin-related protein n=1 Tax=Ruminococcus flavefaciens TaxID=1265 RepID=UPI00046748FB|nr:SpaA isopeptide-forming pilin-related protein [Ruminococcus flavefaciens]